jgi:dihydroorotase (multifunctional complex type)
MDPVTHDHQNLLVRGGTVVRPRGSRREDVRIRAGRVVETGPELVPDGEAPLDVAGLHLLPGVIDAHSHQWEAGFAGRPDFRDGTASAAVGGIATIIDQPLTTPEVVTPDRFRAKVELGERTSFTDFALHAGASPDRLDEMAGLWAAGATGFKVFTCDTGVPMRGFLSTAERRGVLERVAALDAIALVHAEDQGVLDRERSRLEGERRTEAAVFGEWHSPKSETTAVDEMLTLAGETGARLYLVHASLAEAVEACGRARDDGVNAWAETCPHYLTLTDADIRARGHWATTAPPVRDEVHRDRLREQLSAGISVVGSDHCAVLPDRKRARDALGGLPGLPGNETMVVILLDLVARGFVTIERVAALLAENPARLFGLFGRKGAIEPGFDGDLTIVDLGGETVARATEMVGVAGWTPYEGMAFRGRVEMTVIRGRIVALAGRLQVEPGVGRWVARQHGPPVGSLPADVRTVQEATT